MTEDDFISYSDPRPVTEEWLESIGAVPGRTQWGRTWTVGERVRFYFWVEGRDAEMCGGGEVVARTIGQVRRLCHSLGLVIEEGSESHA